MKRLSFILTSIAFTLLFSCNKENRYECIEGSCVEKQNGKYNSIEDCATACNQTIEPEIFNPSLSYGELQDVEGNIYKTITINDQTWMAENLRTEKFSNGELITHVVEDDEWSSLTEAAWCNFRNNDFNEPTHGKLYNWFAVNDERNICPNGWSIPSRDDWEHLILYLDSIEGADKSGGSLKSISTKSNGMDFWEMRYWKEPNKYGTNSTGFSALPNGVRSNNGNFVVIGVPDPGGYGTWWSSSDFYSFGDHSAWLFLLKYDSGDIIFQNRKVTSGRCVRCLKD